MYVIIRCCKLHRGNHQEKLLINQLYKPHGMDTVLAFPQRLVLLTGEKLWTLTLLVLALLVLLFANRNMTEIRANYRKTRTTCKTLSALREILAARAGGQYPELRCQEQMHFKKNKSCCGENVKQGASIYREWARSKTLNASFCPWYIWNKNPPIIIFTKCRRTRQPG